MYGRSMSSKQALPMNHVSDLLSRLRNAQKSGLFSAKVTATPLTLAMLRTLQKAGFIRGLSNLKFIGTQSQSGTVEVLLKYSRQVPAIRIARPITKPSRRVTLEAPTLHRLRHSPGILLLSTSRGVLSDTEARLLNVGGTALAYIE